MDDDRTLVARHATEADAIEMARSLVERGVGAEVHRVPEPEPEPEPVPAPPSGADGEVRPPPPVGSTELPDAPPTAGAETEPGGGGPGDDDEARDDDVPGEGDWGVYTVSSDARRAAVLLGFREADLIDDPDSELEKPPTPWKQILLIWLAALIVIPAAAFLITYYITSR